MAGVMSELSSAGVGATISAHERGRSDVSDRERSFASSHPASPTAVTNPDGALTFLYVPPHHARPPRQPCDSDPLSGPPNLLGGR